MGLGPFPQLIETARTLHGERALTAASSGMEDDTVMLTIIAITVAWLSVAVIYFIAASDRRVRRF
jgi:hypothetical protein